MEFLESESGHNNLLLSHHTMDKIHHEKEKHVLLKFLDLADKSGLKIPYNKERNITVHNVREDKYVNYLWNDYFIEAMSLARHHGLPTRALDWTEDYNVALYFATVGVLYKEDNECDCVLWALNRKIFEDHYFNVFNNRLRDDTILPLNLIFYRPEYNINPRLREQQGIFTIWRNTHEGTLGFSSSESDYYHIDKGSLDEIVVKWLENSRVENDTKEIEKYKLFDEWREPFIIKNNEKIFYKFIIPGKYKKEILNELYLNKYSEEYLFPGYDGVTLSIKNKVKLDN
ncbi:MAG: FRG domain-containing protein [Methanobrevibacter sp.]|nr:FRG domain-containing protein [Candidatus Methanovirga australis]